MSADTTLLANPVAGASRYTYLALASVLAILPWIPGSAFFVHLAGTFCFTAIAVLGLNLLLGLSGQMSLGQAGFYALGAYGSALLALKLGVPVVLAIAFGTAVAALGGVLVGIFALRTRGLYWNNPEATAETMRGGWLHTGDIGMLDETGYLFLLDRAKDMIISGGNNVYPREVEEVIVQHPAVNTVVVFGIPHEYWGEAVHALVVLEPGASVTANDIIDHCGRNLAGYKKPKSVEFTDALPVSGYGKVMRREIREKYWVGHEGRIGGGAPTPKSATKERSK